MTERMLESDESVVIHVEETIRCYAFVAKWHRDHCDHQFRGAPSPPIDAAMGETTLARRAAAECLTKALLLHLDASVADTPLIRVGRDYEHALRVMWAANFPREWEAAREVHHAAEQRLLAAVNA